MLTPGPYDMMLFHTRARGWFVGNIGNIAKFHVVPDVGLWDGPECRNLRIILHNVHVSLSGLRSLHGLCNKVIFRLDFLSFCAGTSVNLKNAFGSMLIWS